MSWIAHDGFLLSTAVQGSREWLDARVGRITASVAAKVMGRSPYHNNNDTANTLLARTILGLEPSKPPTAAMRHGTENEDKVRKWFIEEYCRQKQIRYKVREVGLAVWDQDQRFGASLDGELWEHDGWGESSVLKPVYDEAIEIKCKQRMPASLELRSRPGADLSQKTIPPDDYMQMQIAGFITFKKYVWYVVWVKGRGYYVERVPVDSVKVMNKYIPAMERFYDKYMQPLIDEDPLLKPRRIEAEDVLPKLERAKTEARRQ